MVFIRSKLVRGESYSYLVKSNWDKKRKTSAQETIKYLGRTADITLDDIPDKYRDNSTVLTYLQRSQQLGALRRDEYLKNTQQTFLKFLLEGDLKNSISTCKNFIKFSKMNYFFDQILRPVMYEVGNLWKSNKLDIGSEHIATNTAMRVIETITSKTKSKPNAKTILVCTPVGEYHLLPCLMMETFLLQLGYRVVNLAPSAPTKSIINYVLENKPDLILISITLKDNRNSAKRLLRELTKLKIPILIGGQAVQNGDEFGNAKVLGAPKMTQLSKIIKKEIG